MAPTPTPAPHHQQFGFQTVTETERRRRIRRVFELVAPRYDLMNDLMSFGIHRLWKQRLKSHCVGISGTVVDLAGGTGDVARLLRAEDRFVSVCDPCQPMMEYGRQLDGRQIQWLSGEAEALPLADNSVDLLTVSFGLRNTTRLDVALREIFRVLKPGGRFVCLEFSHPAFWLAPFYRLYSRFVIPNLGAAVARQPVAYQYLIESIQQFPTQREFAALIEQAGFTPVTWKNLSFGIACLHTGHKPLP